MRSCLLAPADSHKTMHKAITSGADAVLIDLEASIAPANKQRARDIAAAFLDEATPQSDRPLLYVRANALDKGQIDDDLHAIVKARPDGIMLPHSLSGKSVTALDVKLQAAEAVAGLPVGAISILTATAGTAGSVFNLGTYRQASPRLVAMTWDASRLCDSIGAATPRTPDGTFTSPHRLARDLCLFGAVSAAVQPIDTVYGNHHDTDGLRCEAEAARRDGFVGKMAIHANQVPIINEVFSPDEKTIDHARRIIEAFDEAGEESPVELDGELIDKSHLTRARITLRREKLSY